MGDITRVYLITGFLGSGKTTFLNRVIQWFPRDQKLMILMNEFGEIGVDGTLVESDELELMEISKGSIFCVCVKTDFIKGLYEIAQGIQPDVLIIESTGVANPSDLKKDLKLPIFKNRFQFMEQFCIIDAAHFLDAYGAYASLEKQIASSTLFIINKTDLATPETIKEIKKVIAKFHDSPKFYETTYADIPLESFFLVDSAEIETPEAGQIPSLSPEQLERFIEDMLDSPDAQITPPDRLMSAAYQWRGQDLKQIQKLVDSMPPSVVRSKGFLTHQDKTYLFSYVMGDWSLEESEIPSDRIYHKNVVVFIGPPESMEGIEQATATGDWSKIGTYQPPV